MAARLRTEVSAQRAHATFYPNIDLAAVVGVQSLGLNMSSQNGSSIGGVGPAVSLPIFPAGRLRGQLRDAEAVANYDRAVVQALQEVADAVVSQKALEPQILRTDAGAGRARGGSP